MSLTPNQVLETPLILRRRNRGIGPIFLAVGLLVVGSAALLYFASSYVIASNVRQTGTLHLVYAWERLISTVREAEVRQRDFLLSDDAADLNAFKEAAARVSPLVKSISAQETDTEIVAQFQDLTEKRMGILETGVELRRTAGIDAAKALIRGGEGKALMMRLESLSTKLREERQWKVEQEMETQDDFSRRLGAVFIVLGAANILVLRWCYRRISKVMQAEEASLLNRYTIPSPIAS